VCTKQPVISPRITARPLLKPYLKVCKDTYILSGPGERVKSTTATIKEKRICRSIKINF
jgi:hypothetical protein